MNLHQVFLELTQLLYPPRCEVCNVLGPEVLCATCREDVVPVGEDLCATCGVPFMPNTRHPDTCADCRGRERPWAFASARAYGLHCGALRRAIIRYKFDNRTQLAPVLAVMLAEAYRATALPSVGTLSRTRPDAANGNRALESAPTERLEQRPDAIIPAVLHPARKKWRGFDQALLLSRHLGKRLDLPVWEDVPRRVKHTRPQIELTPAQRLENLRGAFEARETGRLAGANVILVDDVFTTGATLQAAAAALKRGGAAAVRAVTVTHAVPPWHPAALSGDPPENSGRR